MAPSSVPMVSAPLSASFMFPVPEASVPAVEICSERSAAGMISSARLTEKLGTKTTLRRSPTRGSALMTAATSLMRRITSLAMR